MNGMDALTKGKTIKVFSYFDGESDEETIYKNSLSLINELSVRCINFFDVFVSEISQFTYNV